MDVDLLKALNGFAAAHDAFEDTATFYTRVSVILFAGLLAALFLVVRGAGRRQGPRAVGRVVVGAHYPSDVAAGAALGLVAALALWAPPLRRLLDRVADVCADLWDATLRAGGRALGRA